MVRSFLIEAVAQKTTQRKRIRNPPCNAALRIQSFEVTDQQGPEIHTGSHARPPVLALLVELPADQFYLPVEFMLFQNLVQPLIKCVARRCHDVLAGDPELALLLLFPLAHRHTSYDVQNIPYVSCFSLFSATNT